MDPRPRLIRNNYSQNDDYTLSTVKATHDPSGTLVDVPRLLHLVQNILNAAHSDADEEMKCSEWGAYHQTSLLLLSDKELLSGHSWDAKAVLALFAFAIIYGEFWLAAKFYTSHQLANALAIFKQIPEILNHPKKIPSLFHPIEKLASSAMFDVTECIVKLQELQPNDIKRTVVEVELTKAKDDIIIAVFYVIQSAVACVSYVNGLAGLASTFEGSDVDLNPITSMIVDSVVDLAKKISIYHGRLSDRLNIWYKVRDENRNREVYQNLLRSFSTGDNTTVLKALIYPKDDIYPLTYGAKNTRVEIKALRQKRVLLLISDLDFSNEDLWILKYIYEESRKHEAMTESQYKIVWLPIDDRSAPWTDVKQAQFEALKEMMPWHIVDRPSLIESAVVKYIKEVWHFEKRTIVVVLDPHGQVVCPNALHMMMIWGSVAYPFTSINEEALWKEVTWGLELLVDHIDSTIINWDLPS